MYEGFCTRTACTPCKRSLKRRPGAPARVAALLLRKASNVCDGCADQHRGLMSRHHGSSRSARAARVRPAAGWRGKDLPTQGARVCLLCGPSGCVNYSYVEGIYELRTGDCCGHTQAASCQHEVMTLSPHSLVWEGVFSKRCGQTLSLDRASSMW